MHSIRVDESRLYRTRCVRRLHRRLTRSVVILLAAAVAACDSPMDISAIEPADGEPDFSGRIVEAKAFEQARLATIGIRLITETGDMAGAHVEWDTTIYIRETAGRLAVGSLQDLTVGTSIYVWILEPKFRREVQRIEVERP